jgi:hypothetical protein
MNSNDNFDALWDNFRTAVAEARTPVTVHQPPTVLTLRTKKGPSASSDYHHETSIEVCKDSIMMVRGGALMRCHLSREEALQLAANLVAIHS